MAKRQTQWRILLANVSALVCLVAAPTALERFGLPVGQAVIQRGFGNKPAPKWENGLLLAYEYDFPPPKVFAFDRTGRIVTEAAIRLPDASRVVLHGIAAGPGRVLAVSGSAFTDDGRAAAFIAWIGAEGAVERIVRTSPFAAIRLCFTDDGILWAAGREVTPDFRREPPHDVIRRYDQRGYQIQSLLPSESFARYDSRHPAVLGFLVASKDRVGFYSQCAREWVEISLTGTILGRWKGVPGGPAVLVDGVAMTRSGSVFVSAGRRGVNGRVAEYFRLDRDSGSWLPVDGSAITQAGARYVTIVGSDGGRLVMRSGSKLFWVAAE